MDVLTGDPVPGVGGVWGLGAAGMDYRRAESLVCWKGRAGIAWSRRRMGR